MKGWTSNKDLTRDVKEVSEVTKVIQGEEKEDKVLGVVWKYGRDEFRFKIKEYVLINQAKTQATLTKRTILSKQACVYDSIGLASALIIREN